MVEIAPSSKWEDVQVEELVYFDQAELDRNIVERVVIPSINWNEVDLLAETTLFDKTQPTVRTFQRVRIVRNGLDIENIFKRIT